MKAPLSILAIFLLCLSCNFTPKKSQEAASTPETVTAPVKSRPMTEKERLDAELDSIAAALEAKELREQQVADSLQHAWAQQAAAAKWYERDFSLTLIKYSYNAGGQRKQGEEVKTYTRIGNNVYLHSVLGNETGDVIMEYREGGGRKVRIYDNGVLTKSYEDDSPNPEKYIKHQFNAAEEGHRLLADHPQGGTVEREEALNGRTCQVVVRKVKEALSGSTITDTYWIDKEFKYIAKHTKVTVLGGREMASPGTYEVTAFTDHPTEKDIYRK